MWLATNNETDYGCWYRDRGRHANLEEGETTCDNYYIAFGLIRLIAGRNTLHYIHFSLSGLFSIHIYEVVELASEYWPPVSFYYRLDITKLMGLEANYRMVRLSTRHMPLQVR